MKLYYSPGACSLASHIVAEEEGLSLNYEKVDLKAHRAEHDGDYYAINPKGSVPALKLDDGAILTENVAVLQYLADRKPDAQLAPACDSMERFRLQEWLAFISAEIHKTFAPFFGKGSDREKDDARKKLVKHFGLADKALARQPFLTGDSFTVADAYLFVMLTWTDKTGLDLSKFPDLMAFRERIANRPSVKKAMSAEGLH